jgi:hypothetical protein
MIWGLDQDTAKPEITPSESSSTASETAIILGGTRGVSSAVASQNPPLAANIENTTPAPEQKTRYPSFIEPIDLGPMLAPHIREHAYHPPRTDTSRKTPIGDTPFQQKVQHELHSNRRPALGVGLKPLPRRQELYKNTKPLVTTQPVVGSSLPIIILESQPQSISVPTKPRQSAMEIAQQYRKNQALFQPVTQSQWTSNPSYSPVMQAIHLPALSAEVSESSLLNQTRAYGHSANGVYLEPSAAIDPQAFPTHGLHHAAGFTRVQKVMASPRSDLGSYPRPPPNTPMNTLGKSRMANAPLQMNHLPASPDSPSTAIRSLQHTKGAPLSRLSYRRLSAVLEASEDQNGSFSFRPLSPPPFQQNFHLSRPLVPDGTAYPSSCANPAKDRQNYYYQLEKASDVNVALVSKDFAKLTVGPSTPGWTQSQAQPRASLVKVNSQPVQRGQKMGKAVTSGKPRASGQKHQPQVQAPGRKNRSKKVANGMVVIAA